MRGLPTQAGLPEMTYRTKGTVIQQQSANCIELSKRELERYILGLISFAQRYTIRTRFQFRYMN